MIYQYYTAILNWCYVFSLRTFLTCGNFHSDFLAFRKTLATTAINSTVVNKDVFAAFLLNEAEAFFVIEPFNSAFN